MISNHVKIAFTITLILLTVAHTISMDTFEMDFAQLLMEQKHDRQKIVSAKKKPETPFENWLRWYRIWKQNKDIIFDSRDNQKKPGELTSEGLAYILHCFPQDMLYEIAQHLEAPAHRLIPYIKQHLLPEKKESVYNSHLYTISSAIWVPASKILNVIVNSTQQEVDPLIFRFAGSNSIPIHFTRSNRTEVGIIVPELDHRDPNCAVAQCLIRETARSLPTFRRFVRLENEFIILCTNVRVYEAHDLEMHAFYFIEAFKIDVSPLFAFSDYIQKIPQPDHVLLHEKLFLQADWPKTDWSVRMNATIEDKLKARASSFHSTVVTTAAAPKESSSEDDN